MRSGRPPKPADQKRTRHKSTHEWVLIPRDARRPGAVPALPTGRQFDWLPATRAWWKTIWRSPMATMWETSDIPALVELALLRDELMRGKVSVAGEVRIRSADWGLTLAGRKALRWVLEDEIELTPEAPSDELAAKRDRRERVEAAI